MKERLIPKTTNDMSMLNRYASNPFNGATSFGPRPESYYEDFLTADGKENLYAHLQAGAESGWDYSSRWFVEADQLKLIQQSNDAAAAAAATSGDVSLAARTASLRNLAVMDIVPVDLNALLFNNEITLARLHDIVGDTKAAVCRPDSYGVICCLVQKDLSRHCMFHGLPISLMYDFDVAIVRLNGFSFDFSNCALLTLKILHPLNPDLSPVRPAARVPSARPPLRRACPPLARLRLEPRDAPQRLGLPELIRSAGGQYGRARRGRLGARTRPRVHAR